MSATPSVLLTWSLQALLDRHESYVSIAENEKSALQTTVTNLESTNSDLRDNNARVLSENKELLEQLDSLNAALEASDSYIKSLTATLQSTQHEFNRLKILAARAETFEDQISKLEQEQEVLMHTLNTSVEEERATTQRWRNSQRTIAELQHQVEALEDENRMDKKRHAEILDRHRRRTDIQDAIKASRNNASRQNNNQGSEVVSAFVQEMLEDNTKLQLSVAELREMLAQSQDETEQLRTQISDSQPLPTFTSDAVNTPAPQSLGAELGDHERSMSQELHVHHHFHNARAPVARARTPAQPRIRRKRPSLVSPIATSTIPESGALPSHIRSDSTASSLYSEDPTARARKWTHQHALSRSSIMSSSPPASTIFEAGSDGYETNVTRPSTPGDASEHILSPLKGDDFKNGPSENVEIDEAAILDQHTSDTKVVLPATPALRKAPGNRSLRRSASASSLISVSGMDIHSTFTSYNATSALAPFASRSPAVADTTTGPVVSVTNASASGAALVSGTDALQNLAKVRDSGAAGQTQNHGLSTWLLGRFKPAEKPVEKSTEKIRKAKSQQMPRMAGVNQLGGLPIEAYLKQQGLKARRSRLDSVALAECLEETEEM